MWFQWFSFLGMCATFAEFYVQFALMPFYFEWAPLWGSSPAEGQAIVLGIVTFGCAYVITSMQAGGRELTFLVPSWINEKKDNVSVNKAVWYSSVFGVVMKFIFGWFAACTYRNPKQNANILNGKHQIPNLAKYSHDQPIIRTDGPYYKNLRLPVQHFNHYSGNSRVFHSDAV
jgi:hypothetical protein